MHSRHHYLLLFGILALMLGSIRPAFAIDCHPPAKPVKAWDSQVNKSIIWFGVGKDDIRERVKGAANDVVRKQPEADRLYLQQAMLAFYCVALRDDPALAEKERERLLAAYAEAIRNVFAELARTVPVSNAGERQPLPVAVDCGSSNPPELILPFRKNSYNLDDAVLRQLNTFAQRMKKRKFAGIHLAGYARTGKGAEKDYELSLARAAAVRYALMRSGIPEMKTTIRGLGTASSSIAGKSQPADRVEICTQEAAPHP